MDAKRQLLLEKLFDDALALPAEKRQPFVAENCPDPDLRSELESLLARTNGSTLEGIRHAIWDMATGIGPDEMTGKTVGAYLLTARLGQGGMGVVYLAEQREPLRRRVALKILKHRDCGSAVMARFESESQVLALMEHPTIARVYDAGTTPDGQPYFAMEYVPGIPITDYCDRNVLNLRARLELFRQVCLGVHHAHQKGVVHRDLKPSNVLVMEEAGKPVSKIIDFGLAKAVDQRLVERTLYTEIGALIGTPEYMSPEQAGVTGADVDRRTDIYSLGVLLYELLVGVLPFDSKSLREGGYAETQRMIREDEPPRPSTRLRMVGEAAGEIARRRQSDVRSLIRLVRGDLETITMKALEKDRRRRYESASEFASDIERYSAQKPIVARSPHLIYQASKFLKRRRTALYWISAAILLAAVTGLFFWWRTPQPLPQILSVIQLTDDGTQKYGLESDGSQLYFTEDTRQIGQVQVKGGSVSAFLTSLPNPLPVAMTPDSSAMLAVGGAPDGPAQCFLCFPLWRVPVPAGVPHRLANLQANDASFFPDGEHVLYASGQDIYVADREGANSRLLARVDGPVWSPRVSPDQRQIRFFKWDTHTDSITLWEGDIDGRNLHQLLDRWPELSHLGHSSGSGNWTPDGRYFVFGAERNGRVDLWALPEEKTELLGRRHFEPVRLTSGPMSYTWSFPSSDRKTIFAVGTVRRGELVRFDPSVREFVPFLSGISANKVVFSRDGKWVVYTTYPDHSLWRSRPDGSERLRLSGPPLQAFGPQMSPDGAHIAFFSTKPTAAVYMVATRGGAPQLVRPDAFSPVWSPDGNELALATPARASDFATHILNLKTGQIAPIPDGLLKGPVSWSPTNRLVVANLGHTKLLVFDLQKQNWSQLFSADISARNMFDGAPSVDGKYLYIERREVKKGSTQPIIRIRISDGHIEPVFDIKEIRRVVDPSEGTTLGIAPDGSVLVTRDVGVEEIYSLQVKWP